MNFTVIFANAFLRRPALYPASVLTMLICVICPAINGANAPKGAAPVPQNAGNPMQVTVMDIGGNPLAGVAVMIQPRPSMLLPENISETTVTVTNEAGVFQPPQSEVGDTYVVLRKDGYAGLTLNAARRFPRELTLRPGRTISGQVFTANGQPISGAVVGPVSYPGLSVSGNVRGRHGLLPRMAVRTGADGSFRLEGLPLEDVEIQFSAAGHTPRVVAFSSGENSKKIALGTGGGIIKGAVIGSKDRAPQATAPIQATSGGLDIYTVTDAEGTYVFDNLPTGTWRLRPAGGGPLSGTQSRAAVTEIARINQVQDLPLVLNQGVMLAGRAVDAQTSQGLAGINITLAGYAGHGSRATITDNDGSFEFENLDSMQGVVIRFDPIKFVYLMPGGNYRDYFDLSQAGNTDFDLTTITLPLHRRQQISGRVRDAAGKPVPDVEIRLQNMHVVTSAPSKSGPGPLEFTAYANGAGDFVTGVYPLGQYKVWAQQEAMVSQVEAVDAFTTAPKRQVDLRLDHAAQLDGVLTNAADKPVTAAIVIAWAADSPEPQEDPIPGRENYRFTRSDSNGHFVLSGLRGEPLAIRATHPAYVQPARAVYDPALAQAGTSSSLSLKFPAGGEFSALVVDDAGVPVTGAEVALEFTEGLNGHRVSVMTDSFGRAYLGAIPALKISKVSVNHAAFAPYENPEALPLPQTNMKISLQKRGSLMANVTGKPLIAGVSPEVFLLYAPLVAGQESAPEHGFEQTARRGIVAGQALFPSLPPGWYKVAFADSGAYSESDTVKMEAGSGDLAVDLALPEGNHLVGAVRDQQSGEGIAGANITLSPATDSDIVADRATQNTTTGDGGMFELYNVGAGRLHVKVVAAGYPDYEKTIPFESGQALDITLTNVPAVLDGKVTAAGKPVEGALLVLTKGGGDHTPVATAITDSAGDYNLDGFSAGSYALAVEAPIGEGENISRKSVAVDVEGAHETKNIDFAALVTVTGKVRLNGKVPARDNGEPVTILFRGSGAGSESKMVTIASDGNYSTQLEPGSYQVSLEDREGRPVEIPAVGSHSIDLLF